MWAWYWKAFSNRGGKNVLYHCTSAARLCSCLKPECTYSIFFRELKHKGSSWVKQWFKVAVINEHVYSDSRRSCALAPSMRLPSSTQQGCAVGMPRHDDAFPPRFSGQSYSFMRRTSRTLRMGLRRSLTELVQKMWSIVYIFRNTEDGELGVLLKKKRYPSLCKDQTSETKWKLKMYN